jgi:exosortase
MTAPLDLSPKARPATVALIAAASLLVVWAYWTTLGDMAWRWAHDPQYSHGYLVPCFAAYLLWSRRKRILKRPLQASWLGLPLLGLALAVRLAGAYFHYVYLDQMSLIPCLAGLLLLGGGRPALRWGLPAVGFLAFMVPLPHTWSLALSGPMQSFATVVSTFMLQVLGRPALAEGNVILLNDVELGIVEACSGLRMLVVFFALSTAVAMLIRKPAWERLLVACSAIPIALAANILRITITGLFYDAFGSGFGGAFLHDLAGWLMMPLGLAFLGLELVVLGKLLLDPGASRPLPGQVTLQRVEVGPVSLYRGTTSRRARRAAATSQPPAPEQAPQEADRAAEPVAPQQP